MRRSRMIGVAVVVLALIAGLVVIAPAVRGQTRSGERRLVEQALSAERRLIEQALADARDRVLAQTRVVERALQDARNRVQTVRPQIQILDSAGPEIGVTIREAEKTDGVLVDEVRSGGPASKAGVRTGDVIIEFDGEKVRGVRQLTRLVRETPVGRSVKMAVMRDGKRVDLAVVPEDRAAALTSRGRVLEETLRQLPERDQVFQFRMPDLGRLEVLPEGPYALLDRFSPSAGRLGVMVQEMTPQLAAYFGAKDGVLVTAVTDGSPAATAGLKAGDVITAVNNQAVTSSANLIRLLREAGDGAEVTIGLVRDRKPMTVKAKLESTKPAPRAIRRTIIV